jgi:hypothetical protein
MHLIRIKALEFKGSFCRADFLGSRTPVFKLMLAPGWAARLFT